MTDTPPRRHGRPPVFNEPMRAAYLDLLRHGMRLGEAADLLAISRVTPTRYSRVDRKFATALKKAREVGAKVRQEGVPHDEYRYNILGCRCATCRRCAAEGRAERRAAAEPPGEDGGQVHVIRGPIVESLPAFLLARAS